MPAPTPIQIRYGPAGLLAQAVAQAGANQSSADRDFSFINSQMASRDHMAQVYAQQNQSADQLQQAYAMHTGQQQQQAPDPYASGANDANNRLLKQTYLQSAMPNLPDAEKANLGMLARAKNISPDQFRLAVGDAAKRNEHETDEAGEVASKAAYVKSILPNLPAEARAGVLSLAQDKKTTAAQLRAAGDSVIQQAAVNTHMRAREVAQQMESIRRDIIKMTTAPENPAATVDPLSTRPAALNPAYANAQAPTRQSMGGMDAAKDITTLAGAGSLVSGGVTPAVMARYVEYYRKKRELDQLLSPQQTNAPQGQPAQPKQITPEIAAQFLQQTHGDPNAARQMAAQQGYSL